VNRRVLRSIAVEGQQKAADVQEELQTARSSASTMMFASLGIGFVISLLSLNTSQAVQYSMLVLLFSIFFSGFFLDLRLMLDSIRFISWAIPVTYSMQMLQEVMFRAQTINLYLAAGLVGYGVLLLVISRLLLKRQTSLS